MIAQAAFFVVARQTSSAAAGAAARDAARSGSDPEDIASELADRIAQTVPGAVDPVVGVASDGRTVTATVRFGWRPPGPDLVPLRVDVRAEVPVVRPP